MAAMSGAWLRKKVRHPSLGGPRLTMYLTTLSVDFRVSPDECSPGRGYIARSFRASMQSRRFGLSSSRTTEEYGVRSVWKPPYLLLMSLWFKLALRMDGLRNPHLQFARRSATTLSEDSGKTRVEAEIIEF
jgi:hypothetical protein